MRHIPEYYVHAISPRPILFIHTERDGLVPIDECYSMFAKANEPKKIVTIPDADHYDVYEFVNPPVFEIVMHETVAWYDAHLSRTGAKAVTAKVA